MRSFFLGAVALVSAAALTACANAEPVADGPDAGAPATGASSAGADQSATAAPTSPAAAAPETTSAAPPAAGRTTNRVAANAPVSDLSQLRRLGIDLDKGVLIDVADDGVDRWMQIGPNGVVDFTSTTRTDSTMMALKAAPVRERNRVLIKPPFWNEEVGGGYCVADTSGAALKLEVCKDGRAAQVWTIVPAGDSGQFELHGTYGVVRVDNGKITTGGTGRVGLQTIPFAS